MSNVRFQGFGRPPEIGPQTRLECKICWTVYDPADGDPHWQVPPGTPFDRLPPHWTCPNCAATQDQFMVLPDAPEGAGDRERAADGESERGGDD